MKLENNILAVVEPKAVILPEPIELQGLDEEGDGDKQTKSFATIVPYVRINGYEFNQNEIRSLRLETDGVIPTLDIVIVDSRAQFKLDSFPRDGDVVTLFINSKNESTFKSIHMDFDISGVDTSPATESDSMTVSFNGIAKIPKLYMEDCQHFEAGTSLDHLTAIVDQMGLGLATNVDETADEMTRIQAFSSYIDFITDVVKSSYISDDSFQTFYIDPHYYLNFIDINRMFNSPNPPLEEMQKSLVSFNEAMAERFEDDTEVENFEVPHLLTNHTDFKSRNNFIRAYSLVNESTRISMEQGSFRDVQIYDDNGDPKLDEYTIEALSSENLRDIEEPLKGRRDEERYKEQVKHKYMGRQHTGEGDLANVHANHVYAKIHNARNKAETQKMKLVVTLSSFNPSLYMYQKVPVFLYNYERNTVKGAVKLKEESKKKGFEGLKMGQENETDLEKASMVLDEFLTGYYIVESINYVYRSSTGKMSQEVTLLRREWPSRINNI